MTTVVWLFIILSLPTFLDNCTYTLHNRIFITEELVTMQKINWRGIVFLLLILTLASGLSYLALHSNLTSKANEDSKVMSIAVVNEDDGAVFNDEEVTFGDEFIKSIDKGNDHDWYVVSRGVAENGYERNAYNMMIIIPSDFSEKAVSIDADAPEQVVLNYKINNSSGHEDIKAEAEKTASLLLNDFNRQIIDVYFASVIGNLQNAQENITAIIDEEEAYTNRYNTNVQSPLSNYTSQFEAVKNNTELSKDNFGNLEGTLETFEDSLREDVENNYDYSSNIEDLLNKKEDNSALTEGFYDQLQSFNQGLTDEDVMKQLASLEQTNEAINREFQEANEDRDKTILTETEKIQAQINESKEKLEALQTELEETLPEELKEEVKEKLTEAFDGQFDDLDMYFEGLDEDVHQKIEEQIKELPSLSLEEIGVEHLSDDQALALENSVMVTNKYEGEDDFSGEGEKDQLLTTKIQEIKERLEDGVVLTDEVEIPETEADEQILEITQKPEGYTLTDIRVELPGEEFEQRFSPGEEIELPATEAGTIKVSITVQLGSKSEDEEDELDNDLDILEPVDWKWKLTQEKAEENEKDTSEKTAATFAPKETQVANETTDEDEKEEKQEDKQQENDAEEQKDSESDNKESNEDDSTEKQEDDKDTSENEDNNEENPTVDDADEEDNEEDGDEDEEEDEVKEVEITNNYISHHATSLPIDVSDNESENNSIETLIKSAADTVSDYQKLNSLYELYYGFDMNEDLPEEMEDVDDRDGLVELATEDSLYYSINDKDALEHIIDYINEDVADEVTKEIDEPLEGLIADIKHHKEVIETVDDQSETLAEKITNTKVEAKELNEALSETLENASNWREESLDLAEEHTEIVQSESDEQTAIMTLDGEFQTLLTSSESLAGLAEGNLDSADTVYQTFDAIDEQANEIEQSGTNLVSDAEELSIEMTDKLLDDKEYAENFQDVLANSQVGDRANENLYDFLSNPVDTKNQNTIGAGDTFTPYFLVLICFIVALFTAYALSTTQQKKLIAGRFDEEHTLMQTNLPITGITAGLGVIEGLIIGIVSSYLLDIGQTRLFIWVGILILVMLTMLVVATYLLRQLQMLGMFILLIVLSLYLFFTKALGFGVEHSSLVENVRAFSPLQYVETLFNSVAKGAGEGDPILWIIITLITLLILAVITNLFVVQQSRVESTEGEEHAESN